MFNFGERVMGMIRIYFVKGAFADSFTPTDKDGAESKARVASELKKTAEVRFIDIDEAMVGSLPMVNAETLDLSDPSEALDAIWAKEAKTRQKAKAKRKKPRKATVSGWAIRRHSDGLMFCLPQGEFVEGEADVTLFSSEQAAETYSREFGLKIGRECQIVSLER
jgi:hypothetical protein